MGNFVLEPTSPGSHSLHEEVNKHLAKPISLSPALEAHQCFCCYVKCDLAHFLVYINFIHRRPGFYAPTNDTVHQREVTIHVADGERGIHHPAMLFVLYTIHSEQSFAIDIHNSIELAPPIMIRKLAPIAHEYEAVCLWPNKVNQVFPKVRCAEDRPILLIHAHEESTEVHRVIARQWNVWDMFKRAYCFHSRSLYIQMYAGGVPGVFLQVYCFTWSSCRERT